MTAPSAEYLLAQRMRTRQFANLRLAGRLDRSDPVRLQNEYKRHEAQHLACECSDTQNVLHVRLLQSLPPVIYCLPESVAIRRNRELSFQVMESCFDGIDVELPVRGRGRSSVDGGAAGTIAANASRGERHPAWSML